MKIDTSKTAWNLTPLAKSENDPDLIKKRNELLDESYKFINKWKDRTDYLSDPTVLKEALDEYEFWAGNYGGSGDEGYYFWLRSTLDQNDPTIKAKFNKIKDVGIQISNDIQFFTYRLAKVSEPIQKKFLKSDELAPYRHFLEGLFKDAKYLLSEEEEKVLNMISSSAFSNWKRMVSQFLSKEERTVLSEAGKVETVDFAQIQSLTQSTKKEVRDSAAVAFNDILLKHVDTAEAEINSILEYKKNVDILRRIERPDLPRHISDDIDTEVVDVMLDSVERRFTISQKYYALKAKLFGVDKLEYHERNVPYGDMDKEYNWNDTVKIVSNVFKGLDDEFEEIFKQFVENGHIDVFPKKNKQSGAFCVSFLPTKPVYVLLNHTSKLRDVLTVAHEMGHAINDVLIAKTQNSLNASTPLSTAEVASTFMEDFVLEELLKEANNNLRLSLMMSKLNEDVSSIQRQVAAYRFEQEMHLEFREKGYLAKEDIGVLFQKWMGAYMGDCVIQSSGSENWWVYWSHLRSFFYVYSYASGLLISKALQNFVKQDSKFIQKVKEFLSAGTSDSPKNIFIKMGVDITDSSFWERGLDEIENLLQETEDLAMKLGKIKK